MSELADLREYVEEELNKLHRVFEETANDALTLTAHPDFALNGLPVRSPVVEADIPVSNLTIGDTIYSQALLHLAVTREIPEEAPAFIGFAKRVLGPLPFIPFVRPTHDRYTPLAISATIRQRFIDGTRETIVPLESVGPIEIDMTKFDHDLHAGKLPLPEDIATCNHNLQRINEFMSCAVTSSER